MALGVLEHSCRDTGSINLGNNKALHDVCSGQYQQRRCSPQAVMQRFETGFGVGSKVESRV